MMFSLQPSLWLTVLTLPMALALPGPSRPVRLALDAAPESSTLSQACRGGSHNVSSVSFFEDSGIKMTTGTCAPTISEARSLLDKRKTASFPLPGGRDPGDECDTPCNTVCFKGTKSPPPADCQVIFDALFTRDDQDFTLGQNGFILFTFGACGTSFTNQIQGGPQPQPLTYCYRDWAGAGHWVANFCQSDTGAAGGKCVAGFGSFTTWPDWYMQVYNA